MLNTIDDFARFLRATRDHLGLSQEELAESCDPPVPRTAVAHLEQGYRLPPQKHLQAIASRVRLAPSLYQGLARPEAQTRLNFEVELGELVGRPVSLASLDAHALAAAESAILTLIGGTLTGPQCFDSFREVLVVYGVQPVKRPFFDRYFKATAFQSVETFAASVRTYQSEAIRLFPTFGQAFIAMNRCEDLSALLAPIAPRDLTRFTDRAPWERVTEIPEQDLPHLGYIAAAKLEKAEKVRKAAVTYLREMAEHLESNGRGSLAQFASSTKRREIESLLRLVESRFEHGPMSPLFEPRPDQLIAEANRIESIASPANREHVARTQETGLRNLSQYLAADHMDVYVATSMRTQADFVSVNRFVGEIFEHDEVKALRLRYFNPTQSFIEDRVAKGLVEALMLRRSAATIYLAQKSDSFGKDSEASVALGQGKPVIVYVPGLLAPEIGLNAPELGLLDEKELRGQLRSLSPDNETHDMDREALLGAVIAHHLTRATPSQLASIYHRHWPDFDFDSETSRIGAPTKDASGIATAEKQRVQYVKWLAEVQGTPPDQQPPDPEGHLLTNATSILVALAVRFERRASLFREKHPLALQVILSSGVLNGMLVARSVESCALLLRAVFANDLRLELIRGDDSYRLVEGSTRSTVRVISKHRLLANAFASYYE